MAHGSRTYIFWHSGPIYVRVGLNSKLQLSFGDEKPTSWASSVSEISTSGRDNTGQIASTTPRNIETFQRGFSPNSHPMWMVKPGGSSWNVTIKKTKLNVSIEALIWKQKRALN